MKILKRDYNVFKILSETEAGALIKCLISHEQGEEVDIDNRVVMMAFKSMTSPKTTALRKEKTIPSLDHFTAYAREKAYQMGLSLDMVKLELKYDAWVEAGWKTGKGRAIKDWKATLLNTLPYLKSDKRTNDLMAIR